MTPPPTNDAPVRISVPVLPAGWPVLLVLWLFPILWIVGASNFALVLLAPVMLAQLWFRRSVALPKGTGIWLVFLLWVLLSATQVDTASRGAVWAFRFAVYVTAGVCLVYGYNLSRDRFSSQRLAAGLGFLWLLTVVGGLAAVTLGDVQLTSLIELRLPAGLRQEPFVEELVHPALAQVHDFLGFPVARPAAPFPYTNEWGSHLALLTPFAFVWAGTGHGRRKVLMAIAGLLSLIPMILSLNRGLWLSLGVAAVYAATIYALRGRARPLVGLVAVGALLVITLLVTPLGDLVGARLATGHSDDRRISLYSQSIEQTAESPIVGHGGPVPDPEQLDRAPVGTHGQIWMLLVANGVPAAITFVVFLVLLLWRTRAARIGTFAFATHIALLIACVQLPIYSLIPTQMPLLWLAAGVALRNLERVQPPLQQPLGESMARL